VPAARHTVQNDAVSFGTHHELHVGRVSVRVGRRAGNGTWLNRGKFWGIVCAEVGAFVVQSLAANLFGMQFQFVLVCETCFMNETAQPCRQQPSVCEILHK